MTDPAPSMDQIFACMAEAVEMDPSVKKKFNGSAFFDVEGKTFLLEAKRDNGNKEKQSDTPAADLQVKTSGATLQALLAKKMTPQQAFMNGKLKIKGNMGLAMKLTVVLDATRKQLALQLSKL